MKNKMLIVIGGLLAALLVVGIVGATSAYAQAADNPGFGLMEYGRGPGGGRGWRFSDAEVEAAAKALGMTVDEFKSALKSGKTLQDLAAEKGVDIADVHAAIRTVRIAEMREHIAQAVEDGTMSKEKADWLLEGLDKGFIGDGFGIPHSGRGLGTCPMGQTQTSP
jgi:predicted nuclease with RNAse H fold